VRAATAGSHILAVVGLSRLVLAIMVLVEELFLHGGVEWRPGLLSQAWKAAGIWNVPDGSCRLCVATLSCHSRKAMGGLFGALLGGAASALRTAAGSLREYVVLEMVVTALSKADLSALVTFAGSIDGSSL
jgi:hypothetical protein